MHEMCGRYGIPRSEIWDCTLGEFDALVAGAVARERLQRLDLMMLTSVVLKIGGGRSITPQELIGEPRPKSADDFGDDPGEAYAEFQRQAKLTAKRRRERWHRRWLPAALRSWLEDR